MISMVKWTLSVGEYRAASGALGRLVEGRLAVDTRRLQVRPDLNRLRTLRVEKETTGYEPTE